MADDADDLLDWIENYDDKMKHLKAEIRCDMNRRSPSRSRSPPRSRMDRMATSSAASSGLVLLAKQADTSKVIEQVELDLYKIKHDLRISTDTSLKDTIMLGEEDLFWHCFNRVDSILNRIDVAGYYGYYIGVTESLYRRFYVLGHCSQFSHMYAIGATANSNIAIAVEKRLIAEHTVFSSCQNVGAGGEHIARNVVGRAYFLYICIAEGRRQ